MIEPDFLINLGNTKPMSENYKFHNQKMPYFISFAAVYWL